MATYQLAILGSQSLIIVYVSVDLQETASKAQLKQDTCWQPREVAYF